MVRGHADCSELCRSCQKDCICHGCRRCHFCQCRNRYYLSESHSCITYVFEQTTFAADKLNLQDENDSLTAKVSELANQVSKLDIHTKDLQSDILRTGSDKLLVQRFTSLFSSDTFSVLIGSSKKRFILHNETICKVSIYFKEVLSSTSFQGSVTLYGDTYDIDAFEMFIEYCYLGAYFGGDYNKSNLFLLHTRVFILAESLGCIGLSNLAFEKAFEWCQGLVAQTENLVFQDVYPNILGSVRAVYGDNIDHNYKLLPSVSPGKNIENIKTDYSPRDGFRFLIAYLAARYLTELRIDSTFVNLHREFSDFNTDMLSLVEDRAKPAITDDEEKPSPATVSTAYHPGEGGRLVQFPKERVLAFSRNFNTATIAVFVGKNSKRFDLSIAAIQCSDYFRGLLASGMMEACDKEVRLNSEVDNADAFEGFVQYCYLGDYFWDDERADGLTQHARVYLLADRLGCVDLKELALQKATRICRSAYSGPGEPTELLIIIPTVVAMIYDNTYSSGCGKSSEMANQTGVDASGEPSEISEKKERFRDLLSRFTSVYLSKLRELPSFIDTHYAFPDFATDLMLLATPCKIDIGKG